jgi:hypothetical protein
MDMICSSFKQSKSWVETFYKYINYITIHFHQQPQLTSQKHKKEEVNLGKLYETHLKSDFLNKSNEFLIHEREIKSVFFTLQPEN